MRVLNLLRLGSICVCDLQAVLGIPQPTLSRHLAALRHAGLVRDVRNGTRVIYSLTPPTTPQLKALEDFLNQTCPYEDTLRADRERFKAAVAQGKCRLERNNITG